MTEPAGSEPDSTPARSLLGALLRQAWILSVVYLCCGVVVTLARKHSEAAFWVSSSKMLDAVAEAILVELRLWPTFIRAVAFGQISPLEGRLVLGTITVLVIHAQALFLGMIFVILHSLGVHRAGRRHV